MQEVIGLQTRGFLCALYEVFVDFGFIETLAISYPAILYGSYHRPGKEDSEITRDEDTLPAPAVGG